MMLPFFERKYLNNNFQKYKLQLSILICICIFCLTGMQMYAKSIIIGMGLEAVMIICGQIHKAKYK